MQEMRRGFVRGVHINAQLLHTFCEFPCYICYMIFSHNSINLQGGAALSDYNSIAWFYSISSTKLVSNKLPTEALHISIQTQCYFVYEMNSSDEGFWKSDSNQCWALL